MRQRAAAQLVDEGDARFLKAYPDGKVPAFVVDLDEHRAAQWAMRDNSPYGEWDEQLQAELLYELEQAGADLDLTGLERTVQTKLIDSVAGLKRASNWPDDPAPRRPSKPKSKTGQIYQLGEHRLMCGDATKPEHVKRLLDGARPKLMVTDPPYGVNLDLSWHDKNTKNVKRENTTIAGDTRVDWSQAFELVPSVDVAYIWHGGTTAHEVAAGIERIGFVVAQQIIWDKIHFVAQPLAIPVAARDRVLRRPRRRRGAVVRPVSRDRRLRAPRRLEAGVARRPRANDDLAGAEPEASPEGRGPERRRRRSPDAKAGAPMVSPVREPHTPRRPRLRPVRRIRHRADRSGADEPALPDDGTRPRLLRRDPATLRRVRRRRQGGTVSATPSTPSSASVARRLRDQLNDRGNRPGIRLTYAEGELLLQLLSRAVLVLRGER
jgi:hypothetical protein